MAQTLYPSAHILEMFMPYLHDEQRLIAVLRKVAAMDFYRNVELPSFPTKAQRGTVRSILQNEGLSAITFVAPYVNEAGLSLCDLDDARRERAMELLRYHAELAADCGYMTFGVPSGPDPGEALRPAALEAQADSVGRIADYCAQLHMKCSLEPLDRYTHKKGLVGPMDEAVAWFAPLRAEHPNLYLHWDSAHEQLGGLGVLHTLELAAPYLSQIHLCDCINDPAHPCFGDLHMEPAHAPDWTTEGFLTPELGAQIIRRAADFEPAAGVDRFWISIEVLGHRGDDLWHKEKVAREFLQRCWALSGVPYGR
ncbi:MAG: sugar phosphate isomerase/epimerase [Oscillospiraceae bacterium]|nr:sugar phosphate isomerase/epimerase [Oscillospiraceae bacterium]